MLEHVKAHGRTIDVALTTHLQRRLRKTASDPEENT
jgi:hypothetical protein